MFRNDDIYLPYFLGGIGKIGVCPQLLNCTCIKETPMKFVSVVAIYKLSQLSNGGFLRVSPRNDAIQYGPVDIRTSFLE